MLVIFDCDGVLVDSERLVSRLESKLLCEWGWSLSPQQAHARFKGRALPDIVREIEGELGQRLPPQWLYLWGMSIAAGFERQLRAVDGVTPVLRQLLAAQTPICVASQSPLPRVALSLSVCGLTSFFGPNVYTASMVTRPKPAPDLFQYAAAQMGVPVGECVVVEDSPGGVRAAVSAGMRVLGYHADEPAERLSEAGAELFNAMRDLPQLLGV